MLADGQTPFRIWSTKNAGLNKWQFSQSTTIINAALGSYKVYFSYEIGMNHKGYIAIDDILVHEGACKPLDFCTFEENECGYTHDLQANFQWKRGTAAQASTEFTGPATDVSSEVLSVPN